MGPHSQWFAEGQVQNDPRLVLFVDEDTRRSTGLYQQPNRHECLRRDDLRVVPSQNHTPDCVAPIPLPPDARPHIKVRLQRCLPADGPRRRCRLPDHLSCSRASIHRPPPHLWWIAEPSGLDALLGDGDGPGQRNQPVRRLGSLCPAQPRAACRTRARSTPRVDTPCPRGSPRRHPATGAQG